MDPINGETFLPQLLVDFFTYQRTKLGFPDDLALVPAPGVKIYTAPALVIGCLNFQLPSHDAIGEYDVHVQLQTARETPQQGEDTDAATARRAAALKAENALVSKVRRTLAMGQHQYWQTIEGDDTTNIISLFDWINTVRTVPNDEDGWALNSFKVTGGGIEILAEKNLRVRATSCHVRLQTNEFAI